MFVFSHIFCLLDVVKLKCELYMQVDVSEAELTSSQSHRCLIRLEFLFGRMKMFPYLDTSVA